MESFHWSIKYLLPFLKRKRESSSVGEKKHCKRWSLPNFHHKHCLCSYSNWGFSKLWRHLHQTHSLCTSSPCSFLPSSKWQVPFLDLSIIFAKGQSMLLKMKWPSLSNYSSSQKIRSLTLILISWGTWIGWLFSLSKRWNPDPNAPCCQKPCKTCSWGNVLWTWRHHVSKCPSIPDTTAAPILSTFCAPISSASCCEEQEIPTSVTPIRSHYHQPSFEGVSWWLKAMRIVS